MVSMHMPPAYATLGPTLSHLNVDMEWCEKTAVDGIDRGPAAFIYVGPAIKHPEGAPKGEHKTSLYMIEIQTNNEHVAKWLNIQPIPLTIEYRYDPHPQPSDYGTLEVSAKSGSAPMYDVIGFPEKTIDHSDDRLRWFYGPNPATDFWEMSWTREASQSDGPGTFRAVPDSKVGRVLGGAAAWESLTERENAGVFQWWHGAGTNE